MVGQCNSMLQNYDDAIDYLNYSVGLNNNEAPVWLSLGIAYQKKSLYEKAVKAFVKAIKIDRNYSFAYNSLAYTQFKYLGNLEHALQNYEAAIKAYSNCVIKNMINDISSPILKTIDIDGKLWIEYAMQAAMYLCALEGIRGLYFPTGKQAKVEERYEYHKGLYWSDGDDSRLYLPNYFNTFKEILKTEKQYYLILYNKAEVLQALGKGIEAELHFTEAEMFSS
jgi:tetratricopeptide (TPR) repeat protein